MANVSNGVETLPKISTSTNLTDRRQTDGRRHIENVNSPFAKTLLSNSFDKNWKN